MKVKTEPRRAAKPFSREEIQQILAAFEANYYHHFVRFLLGVGCRIGEAIALEWAALNEDCSEVWIGKAWDAKGKRVKSTKTNETRTVPISPNIQKMLQELREQSESKLVFPAPKGGYIDGNNFLKRHWKPLFENTGIEYRTLYNSRHTRWSHEIESGNLTIAEAADYAGNSRRTMMDRYYGATKRPRLKDFD
nr:tyrosine-type recombinase/integrase [Leptolyngbya sp. FACHB-17]